MKNLLKSAYQSDHTLEVIFSSLRWSFLVLSIGLFFAQYIENPVSFKFNLFFYLVVFGFVYMGVSEYYLHKAHKGSRVYVVMTKGGPLFDFIAFSALVPLTGGIDSPLFPIAYLIILHVTVYWKLVGGMISSLLFISLYSLYFFIQVADVFSLHHLFNYISQVFFLLLIGFLGGIIVSRERKHHSEKSMLVEAVNRDYLTNLLNHRSFQEHLRKDIENGKVFYLVLADIDHFKLINDTYGHVTGDKVLHQIGDIFTSILPVDQGKSFRYGGEEFAIIIYTSEYDVVDKLLAKIKEAVSSHTYYYNGEPFSVTLSFGCYKHNGEAPTELVEKVDKLLYEAKNRGRNRIAYSLVG